MSDLSVIKIDALHDLKDILRAQQHDVAIAVNAKMGFVPVTGVTMWIRNKPELHAPIKRQSPAPVMLNSHPVPGYTEFLFATPDTYEEALETLAGIYPNHTVADAGHSGLYL